MRNAKLVVIILIIIGLCFYVFKLKMDINDLRKNTIPVNTIESRFYNTLKSFENDEKIDNGEIFFLKKLVIRNSNDLAEFYGISNTLITSSDKNMLELISEIGDYYNYLQVLNNKLQDGDVLTSDEKEKYVKIFKNMKILQEEINKQGIEQGSFKNLGDLYSQIKGSMKKIDF